MKGGGLATLCIPVCQLGVSFLSFVFLPRIPNPINNCWKKKAQWGEHAPFLVRRLHFAPARYPLSTRSFVSNSLPLCLHLCRRKVFGMRRRWRTLSLKVCSMTPKKSYESLCMLLRKRKLRQELQVYPGEEVMSSNPYLVQISTNRISFPRYRVVCYLACP